VWATLVFAALLVTGFGPGCSSADVASGRALSEACALTSDCAKGLICALGKCRVRCVSTADCPVGGACVTDGQNAVCQTAEENATPCDRAVDCPSPLACASDYHCRNLCQTSADCNVLGATGRVCGTDGQGVRYCADPVQVDAATGAIVAEPPDGAPDVAVIEPTSAPATQVGAIALTIGPEGGTLGLSGVTVTIPPGALDRSIVLSITPIAAPVPGIIGQAYEIGPTGTTFKTPISIVFAYAGAELQGRPPSAFSVSTVVNHAWQAVSSPLIDSYVETIGGTTTHLSPYALVANETNGTFAMDAAAEGGALTSDATTGADSGGSGDASTDALVADSSLADVAAVDAAVDATVHDSGGTADSGTTVVDAGTPCPVPVTLAIASKLTIPVTWPATTTVAAGSGNVNLWTLTDYTTKSTTLTGTTRICGYAMPAWTFTSAGLAAIGLRGAEAQVVLPSTTWEAASMPTTNVAGALAAWTTGSAVVATPFTILDGLSHTGTWSSVSTAWPAAEATFASTDLVDDDGDGTPGIAATMASASPYTNLPAALNGDDGGPTPLVQSLSVVLRTSLALNGTLTSCGTISGSVTVQNLNSHVVGCTLTDTTTCSATEVSFVDGNAPALSGTSGTFSAQVLAVDGAASSCADVLTAVP
jgi:hypothetical protein